MRRGALLALGLGGLGLVRTLGGCRRTEAPPILPDPPAKADAAPKDVPAPSLELLLVHGKSIDPRAAVIRHVLRKDLPRREAAHGDDAYLLGRAAPQELFAHALGSGALRWAKPAPGCALLAATKDAAYCAKDATLTRFARTDGETTTLTLAADASALLPLGGRLLVIRVDRGLDVLDETGKRVAGATLPFAPYGHREPMVATAHGTACAASAPGASVEIACYDQAATLVRHTTHVLAKPTDPKGAWFTVRTLDRNVALVTTWASLAGVRRSVLIDLGTGTELARVEAEVASAVLRPDGGVEALLVARPKAQLLDPTGAVRWTTPETLEESASTVLVGGVAQTLVVASFHRIATGADLRGFDLSTGKLRFTAAVELLPISHSKYWNETSLSLVGGHLALRGKEAGQDYLELFDPTTGARKLTELVEQSF